MAKTLRILLLLLCIGGLLILPGDSDARVGGGSSYSGGGGGGSSYSGGGGSSYGGGSSDYGGGGGGGGGAPRGKMSRTTAWIWSVFFLFMVATWIAGLFKGRRTNHRWEPHTATRKVAPTDPVAKCIRTLRKDDPNFSKFLFLDFATLLFSRFNECRVGAQFAPIQPYIEPSLYKRLQTHSVSSIDEIAIGSVTIDEVKSKGKQHIAVVIEGSFKVGADDGSPRQMYAKERWTFQRQPGVLSPTPDKVLRLDCPSCGHSGELDVEGHCSHCQNVVNRGAHGWVVTRMQMLESREVEPVQLHIDSGGVEPGTRNMTVFQSDFAAQTRRFQARNPNFSWDRFYERVRFIFHNLQTAWSSLEWERARAYETDALFQMHRYWIQRYQRQNVRNALEQIQLIKSEVCKIEPDPFYETMTVRMHASMLDYTVDPNGRVVGGNNQVAREFTEYWTFIRRSDFQDAPDKSTDDSQCPSCGAAVKVNAAGVCEYCQSKISSGDFDWVLALIEQDEAYQG